MSGKSFTLNHAEASKNIHVYHVKLTESALKAFENASKQPKLRPKIRFSENSGEISIPNNATGNFFTFSMAPTNDDSKSSFECVKMSKFQMDTIGNMSVKMTINGNDDVFSMTKQKFDHLEDEQRKSIPQFLKSDSKLKKKTSNSGISKIKQQLLNGGGVTHIKQQISQIKPGLKATTPVKGSLSSDQSVNKTSRKSEESISSRSLKDRIVHLLALRNYNKPELIIRLSKDGLRSNERGLVEEIAQQVATLDRKNQYVLKPQLLAQVNEKDWAQFYSPEDLHLLKGRKNERKQSSLSIKKNEPSVNEKSKSATSDSGSRPSIRAPFAPHPLATKIKALDLLDSGLSPLAVSLQMHMSENLILLWRDKADSLREMQVRKRQRQGELEDSSPAKSPRLSNSGAAVSSSNAQSFTPPVHSDQSFTTSSPPPPQPLVSHLEESPHSEKENRQEVHRQSPTSPSSTGTPRSMSSTQNTPNTPASSEPAAGNNTSRISPCSTMEDGTAVTKPFQARSNIRMKDDLCIPDDMDSSQLRDHLKRQFNRIYPEYTHLYNLIHEKSRQIEQWDHQLQSLSVDSAEYDTICDSIIKMYHEVKNPEFRAQSEKLQLLHEKLSSYKKRIRELDCQMNPKNHPPPRSTSLNKISLPI